MSDDNMLNDTGRELADSLGISEDELLGGLKSTQYNLAWKSVREATLEKPNDGDLDSFKRNLGRACKGIVDALSVALEYDNIQQMAGTLRSIDNRDAQKMLEAVNELDQIGSEGLIDVGHEGYGTPNVNVNDMGEASKLGHRLRKVKTTIESTQIHAQLQSQ